jgi:DNA-binding CsgD family transcriptional regulator
MQATAFETITAPAFAVRAMMRQAEAVNETESAPSEPELGPLLDALDYGVVALRDTIEVVGMNRAAAAEVRAGASVTIVAGRLCACRGSDADKLGDAMHAAAHRGLRRLVTVGAPPDLLAIALMPVGNAGFGRAAPTVAVFGRRRLCARLSVQCFARAHGLTLAESQVLEQLCDGLDPRAIASINQVRLSTVRTQVGRIREKTGAACIRSLIRQVAMLPPIVGALAC